MPVGYVIAEFSAIYGIKIKTLINHTVLREDTMEEVIETMEDLFLLALFEIYTNCVL